MKKLSLLLFLITAFVFTGCSDDDDKGISDKDILVASFEGMLTEANSEFTSESEMEEGYYFIDSFQDKESQITFTHYYSFYPDYTFSGFTYMNYTDNSDDRSTAAITKKGKDGTTYLGAYTNDYTPAGFTINNPETYKIKGVWVTNNTWAYNAMTTDKIGGTTPFTNGSWFKLTASESGINSVTPGKSVEIYLANYTSDDNLPVNEWIWFDLSELGDAETIVFSLSSTDNGEWGMNTPAFFCMDGITLEER